MQWGEASQWARGWEAEDDKWRRDPATAAAISAAAAAPGTKWMELQSFVTAFSHCGVCYLPRGWRVHRALGRWDRHTGAGFCSWRLPQLQLFAPAGGQVVLNVGQPSRGRRARGGGYPTAVGVRVLPPAPAGVRQAHLSPALHPAAVSQVREACVALTLAPSQLPYVLCLATRLPRRGQFLLTVASEHTTELRAMPPGPAGLGEVTQVGVAASAACSGGPLSGYSWQRNPQVNLQVAGGRASHSGFALLTLVLEQPCGAADGDASRLSFDHLPALALAVVRAGEQGPGSAAEVRRKGHAAPSERVEGVTSYTRGPQVALSVDLPAGLHHVVVAASEADTPFHASLTVLQRGKRPLPSVTATPANGGFAPCTQCRQPLWRGPEDGRRGTVLCRRRGSDGGRDPSDPLYAPTAMEVHAGCVPALRRAVAPPPCAHCGASIDGNDGVVVMGDAAQRAGQGEGAKLHRCALPPASLQLGPSSFLHSLRSPRVQGLRRRVRGRPRAGVRPLRRSHRTTPRARPVGPVVRRAHRGGAGCARAC